MQIISINVGLPRTVTWKGRPVTTGIFKAPVSGPVAVRTLNLDGDRQADLSVHGGPDKAVYAYASEHYGYWRAELPELELDWGAFGENLTTEGLIEDEVRIGDRFRIGTAELVATQPRQPCYKLEVRFDRDDMVKRFVRAGRHGVYFAVAREGIVTPGDRIEPLDRDPNDVTVADIARLYVSDTRNVALMRRAINVPALPDGWREYFVQRLAKLTEGARRPSRES